MSDARHRELGTRSRHTDAVKKQRLGQHPQGLADVFRFVYSGTLAMKTQSSMLVELAKGLLHHAANNVDTGS